MRPLELLIPSLLSVSIFFSPTRPMASLALIAAIIVHLAVEKYRWQMMPLYGLTFILIAVEHFQPQPWSAVASVPTFGLVILATALPILLPIPHLPTPTGPHQVGTRHFMLVDNSRQEIYSDKNEARKFMIQVWYPANPRPTDKFAPWMPNADIYSIYCARFLEMPDWFLNHLHLVRSRAFQGAPFKEQDKYPVIFFSHGWMGFRAQNTAQALLLASHGFVVIGFEHPYGAMVTVFPDGSVAPNNPSAMPPEELPTAEYETKARKLVKQWAEDMSFALDQFQSPKSEAGAFLQSHLDFARIGVYGHSTGGGAAIQFCGIDARSTSLLGMDPFMRPVSEVVLQTGVRQPSFFMFSEEWYQDEKSRNNDLFAQFHEHTQNSKGVIGIRGTKHFDFSDIPWLSPIAPQMGVKGPLNGKRVTEIVDAYLLAFFQSTLGDTPQELFSRPSRYSEVKSLK